MTDEKSNDSGTVPLVERGIYRIHSRNLTLGVYTGAGFIGIREKFGSLYLDTEYPWETGPPHGTVRIEGRERVGWCPPEVELKVTLGTRCVGCDREVNFDAEVMQWAGCVCQGSTRATSIPNRRLFQILDNLASPQERADRERAARVWARRSTIRGTRDSTR